MPASRFAAAMLALLLGGGAANGQVYSLQSGTFVDPSRGAGYIAKPGGAIQAVDLTTGAELWTNWSASQPIGANETYVAGQPQQHPAGVLPIIFLDVQSGIALSQANIPLPPEVIAAEAGRGYVAIRAEAVPDGSDFVVSWYGDDALPFGQSYEPVHYYMGTARVDPRTGVVKTSDGGSVPDLQGWQEKYVSTSAPPWQAGSITASTDGFYGPIITLKRTITATGQRLPDLILSSNAVEAFPTVDDRDLVLVEKASGFSWHISVFEMESGAKIGDFFDDFVPVPALVFGGTIITPSPLVVYYQGSPSQAVVVPSALLASWLPGNTEKWRVTRVGPNDGSSSLGGPPRRRSAHH